MNSVIYIIFTTSNFSEPIIKRKLTIDCRTIEGIFINLSGTPQSRKGLSTELMYTLQDMIRKLERIRMRAGRKTEVPHPGDKKEGNKNNNTL